VIGQTQKHQLDNRQKPQQTDIHASAGFELASERPQTNALSVRPLGDAAIITAPNQQKKISAFYCA
jgi:hypothetical protein